MQQIISFYAIRNTSYLQCLNRIWQPLWLCDWRVTHDSAQHVQMSVSQIHQVESTSISQHQLLRALDVFFHPEPRQTNNLHLRNILFKRSAFPFWRHPLDKLLLPSPIICRFFCRRQVRPSFALAPSRPSPLYTIIFT